MLAFVFFLVGLVLLIKGANLLVSGASSLSVKLKISPMVIGLTVVAFGTSSPELVVSVLSAFQGQTDLAFGNIVGSNIANILLILGISAAVYPLKVHKNTVLKEIPMSFLAALLLVILGLQNIIDNGFRLETATGLESLGSLTLSNGLVLLSFFVIFMYYSFGIAKQEGEGTSDVHELPTTKSVLFVIAGLLGLAFGSKLLIDSAVVLAQFLGMSDSVIGLTLVAFGTSLPELVTSVTAATKKQVDLAVGNVVGSNIFNIFLVLGVTALVKPIPLISQSLIDIGVLFVATIILFGSIFIGRKHLIGRTEGIIMAVFYIVYVGYLFVRG